MAQTVVVQVGQCGNQIGRIFWDSALRELLKYDFVNIHENGFFRCQDVTDGKSFDKTGSIRARALLVDMEEGVISETLRGPLRELFDSKQLVTDVSGSGNNWAVGHHIYGKRYETKFEELLLREVEMCDNLQCFFLLHSMGGGTGSGLGTAVLDLLRDMFPKKQKFVFAVYPSSCDDVVTSSYNAVLANNQLIENADCVFPIENEALIDMSRFIDNSVTTAKFGVTSYVERPFDRMNHIVADLLLNMTSSSRFPGVLNIDLNELVTNMVPYPRLHYITSSMTPLATGKYGLRSQTMNQIFADLFSPHHRFLDSELRRSTCLACAAIFRGHVYLSDVERTVERIKCGLRFVPWNTEGFKIGLCNIPPLNHPFSAVMLSNTSSITQCLGRLKSRFLKMYRKRAHLHHYLEVDGMEKDFFNISLRNLDSHIDEYSTLQLMMYEEKPRIKVLV